MSAMMSGSGAPQRRVGESYARVQRKFDTAHVALKYAAIHRGSRRDRREQRCVLAALEGVPRGARVLDLPCGAGRLAPMLVERGFVVTGADASPHMVAQAERAWRLACSKSSLPATRAVFETGDVMQTRYGAREFDAVICNRLIHHFPEAETRRTALAELRRISRGPVIVSYFDSFSLEEIRLAILRVVFHRYTRDRIPISAQEFADDGRSVGLVLERTIATRWGISPQHYAVFQRAVP